MWTGKQLRIGRGELPISRSSTQNGGFDLPATVSAAPSHRRMEGSFRDQLRGQDDPDYKPLIDGMFARFRDTEGPVTHASDVAEAIWQAAIDPSSPLRIPAGADAVQWMAEAA